MRLTAIFFCALAAPELIIAQSCGLCHATPCPVNAQKIMMVEETRRYWQEIFPWEPIVRFLGQGDREQLGRREVGIKFVTVTNGHHKEIMVRNKAYLDESSLKDAVVRNAEQRPAERVEFGPMFPGVDRKDSRLDDMPLLVELRFDIDVMDYDRDSEVYGPGCFMCNAFRACEECWKTRLEPSRQVLEYILKETLGAKHILWVFSGKKGYHGIVLDRCFAGRYMPDTIRKLIVNQVVNPTDEKVLSHIYDNILWPIFTRQYLEKDKFSRRPDPMAAVWLGVQRPLNHPNTCVTAMRYIREDRYREEPEKWEKHKRGVLRALYWPRIDEEISIKCQHLLKIPFSIHDGTKKISVPILDPATFKPENAPTLEQICSGEGSLEPYVKHFERLLDAAYDEDEGSSDDSSSEEAVPVTLGSKGQQRRKEINV